VGLLLTNVIIILVYRRVLNTELEKDMEVQVSSSISQYVALSQIPELNAPDTSKATESGADSVEV